MSSTPSSPADRSVCGNYLPITVAESPGNRTPQKGNLTGSPRVIKDFAAETYNIVQRWNAQHILGAQILTNIASLKTSTVQENNPYPEGLQQLCDKLEQVCFAMQDLVSNLKSISLHLERLVQYEEMHVAGSAPVFLTWHTEKYGEVLRAVVEAYDQELVVKKCVLENVAHCSSEETVMLHLASWAHQPYITPDLDVLIESLLLETGHRT